jgi:hypothetical protein
LLAKNVAGKNNMSGFDGRIALWRKIMPPIAAELKRAQRAQAAPRAPVATPRAPQARTPIRFSLDPTEVAVPRITDFLDSTDTAAKIVDAGRMARGELLIPAPPVTGMAAKIHEAAQTARDGGPQRPAPEGLAAKIIAAGEKRRKPMGG